MPPSHQQLCHVLIGPPGSGKSTLAKCLQQWGYGRIISTDAIRQHLYGDEQIQGNWGSIEAEVFAQLKQAVMQKESVIYDATHAKRAWRLSWLTQLKTILPDAIGEELPIIAWHLTTPLTQCYRWNQKRQQVVPNSVIAEMQQSLQQFPPIAAEGYTRVISLKPTHIWQCNDIEKYLKRLPQSVVNRQNRNHNLTLHPYSRLIDFERLLHLLALLLEYPGLGEWHETQPHECQRILGIIPQDSLTEISQFMQACKGKVYADSGAIAADLQWLEMNGFFTEKGEGDWILPKKSEWEGIPHAYSDWETMTRLLKTIRFILHHPLLPVNQGSALKTLVAMLEQEQIVPGIGYNVVRKDIEMVLKPYQILPNFPLRRGYFLGTAILSSTELQQVFEVLQSQAHSLEEPVTLEIYETFRERMVRSQLESKDSYPVRAIANRCIVDGEILHSSVLLNQVQKVEAAILQGELLELNQVSTGGRFPSDPSDFFQAWPLQIVFYNFAWYLGMEIEQKEENLFRFQRLDRLFQGTSSQKYRSVTQQKAALKQLQRLLTDSPSLYLGDQGRVQQQWLSHKPTERKQATMEMELWFTENIYRFIAEGTKRFPPQQMQLSPPSQNSYAVKNSSLFCLKPTQDKQFPHRVRLKLPIWSVEDIDWRRWVLGFGGEVKVIEPLIFQQKIQEIAAAIRELY